MDFLTILFTGKNLENTNGLHGILTFMWFGPIVISGIYLFMELIVPDINSKLKKVALIYMLGLMIIYEFFLFLDPFGSIAFNYPDNPGENLINNAFINWSPLYILLGLSLFPGIIISEVIVLYKSIKSTGVVRRKLFFFLMAIFLFFGFGAIDVLIFPPEMVLILIRCGMISSGIFLYLSIREENVKIREGPSKEDILLEESKKALIETLSISRPEEITQEDIKYYREHTICIVCKKNVVGFVYLFICPNCKSFYCENCARELIQIENMCWGCLEPIDKSMPIKPAKEEEEEGVVIKVSDKAPKKINKDDIQPTIEK